MQAEIEGLLGTSLTKLFEDNPSQQRSIPVAAKAGGFKLQQRTLHVFAEAQRVKEFQRVCNNDQLSQEDKLKQLGDYMDASQTSCRCVSASDLVRPPVQKSPFPSTCIESTMLVPCSIMTACYVKICCLSSSKVSMADSAGNLKASMACMPRVMTAL